MSNLSKTVSLILMLTLLTSTVFVIWTVSATSTPSVPTFTITITDASYDTPSTSSVNGFTGEITITEGEHIEMCTVTFTVKNQDNFTPYTIQNNSKTYTINYLYNLRWKGQYEDNWHTCFIPEYGIPSMDYESDYTISSYNCGYSDTDGLSYTGSHGSSTFPVGAVVDFQVQAMIGYTHFQYVDGGPWGTYVFEGETSDWSNTQTLTVEGTPSEATPTESLNLTPNQTSTQSHSWDSDWLLIIIAVLLTVIVALLVIAVFYLRKRTLKHTINVTN